MKDSFLDFNEKNWPLLKRNIKKIVGDTAYNNWFKQLSFISIENTTITLSVPTKFLRDWIVNNYADKVKNECKKYVENIEIIKFVVKPNGGRVVPGTARTIKDTDNHWKTTMDIRSNQTSSYPSDFGAPLDPRFNFDNFVVGKPNELAFAASQRVAESQTVTFNPLFLYGGVGLGKTHLMHSIAWRIREINPNRQVVYLSAEKFMYQFVRALRQQDTMVFKEQFRSADVLMVDDVQFIAGKDSTQEEFFHTFNALIDKGSQIVISSDRAPIKLTKIQERIKSRFSGGLVVDIQQSDFDLRLSILKSKINEIKKSFPNIIEPNEDLLNFIASEMKINIRETIGALNRIISFSGIYNKSPSISESKIILKDLINYSENYVTIENIKKTVCDYFKINVSEMLSQRRSRYLVRPRQIAMYLTKNLTSKSLPDIGREFSGRDHTTVIHSVKTIDKLKGRDEEISKAIEKLKNKILYKNHNEV